MSFMSEDLAVDSTRLHKVKRHFETFTALPSQYDRHFEASIKAGLSKMLNKKTPRNNNVDGMLKI